MPKTWQEKFNTDKEFQVKKIDKKFADMPEGTVMLIATPKIVDAYVNEIPEGVEVDIKTIRKDLAAQHNAEMTCPVTTSIFLRIVSEVALDKLNKGEALESVTPFWRVVSAKTPLAKKLSCGVDFIIEQRKIEGLS